MTEKFRRTAFFLTLFLSVLAAAGATRADVRSPAVDPEEPIVFPADAGVIDVTKAPYNAKGDGQTDDTDAIQHALDDYPSANRIIYLPDGVYLVSHQIEFGLSRRLHPQRKTDGHDSLDQRLTILQGQSRDRTVIRLKDHATDFQTVGIRAEDKDIGRPIVKGVIWTGENVAQHFRNAIRNLTVVVGKGNPGAAGVQFNASNQGCMHAVKIVSDDGAGGIGLDLGFTGDSGPACARHIEIEGFDYGIWGANLNSFTLWDITLRRQAKAGIRSPFEVLMLHDVRSDNRCPALWIGNRWSSHVTLIDAKLKGGASDQAAIVIDGKPNEKHFFARDVSVTGYGKTVRSTTDAARDVTGDIEEYCYGQPAKAFADCVTRTLRLPEKPEPSVPWGDVDRDWASVLKFGAVGDHKTDDSMAVQKAIDSGAKVVYFPAGKTYDLKRPVVLRGNVQRFIACEAYINGELVLDKGTAPAVIVERFMPSWDRGDHGMVIRQRSKRSLVVRDINGEVHQESLGDVFIDDVVGGLFMDRPGASAWCRYFNYEMSPGLGLVNHGGKLWIMGGKVEHPNPQVELLDGSKTEIFGAMWYAGFGEQVKRPGMRIVDSAASIIGHRQHSFGSGRWDKWIEVQRDGKTMTWTDWSIDFLSTARKEDLSR